MTITTKSKFYYGFTVSESNRFINFDEGTPAAELTAELAIGTYTAELAATEVARAMTEASDLLQTYTVTFNRTTRFYTIAASSAFTLLPVTGSQVGQSYFSDIGFTTDRASLTTHDGDIAAGSVFTPQFRLQKFVDAEDNQSSISAKVNESGNGEVLEIVRFGTKKIYELNVTMQTDLPQGAKNGFMDNDPSGVANIRTFLEFCTQKNKLEFMKDRDIPATFDTILLESTASDRTGTGFKLRELITKVAPGYFESGVLKYRKL